MSYPAAENAELSIVLPLGVIANQLLKVEADLRFLIAKTSTRGSGRSGDAMAGQIAAKLESINEALEVIRGLVADIETDMQPRSANSRSLGTHADRDD
jgi:hypothetical protein